jgi:hypothetical protein
MHARSESIGQNRDYMTLWLYLDAIMLNPAYCLFYAVLAIIWE